MCVNLSARGPTVRAYLKIWPLLGAKFGGQPQFWKFATTDRISVYTSCKFDVDTLKGFGDTAPWILAGKRK